MPEPFPSFGDPLGPRGPLWDAPDRQGALTFEQTAEARALVIDVEGFEGPLDVLLTLARGQKLDLRKISILQLAEQYLVFVETAKKQRIELVADYLVMAAWLAYLKSRLLLPPDPEEEGPSAEEMADRLAWQLQRLEAMRRAAARLMARDVLDRERFARGAPEPVMLRKRVVWDAQLIDLMRAYARVKTRMEYQPLHMRRDPVYSMEMALERLRAVVGMTVGWRNLLTYLPPSWREDPKKRRSAVAACFAASLEMAKRGEVEIRQDDTFGEIRLRATGGRRPEPPEPA